MKDVILTKRQVTIGFLTVFILLLPQLLALKFDNYILKLIIEDGNFFIYMGLVVVMTFVLEKKFPKAFGEIKEEKRIERSPFILYFFIGSMGLIAIGMLILWIIL